MAEENEVQGGEVAAPSDDLRSTIAAAVASQRETPAAEPATKHAEEPVGDKPEDGARADGRDAQGRFAAKPEVKDEAPKLEAAPGADKAADQPQVAPDQAKEPLRPPPGWSPQAKVAFDKADPAIREAVAKREQEINQGFAKLADYKGLDEYADLAKRSGTTLGQAFQNYRAVETTLQRDFVGGIASICKQFGVDPKALANVLTNGASAAQPAPQHQPIQIDPNAIIARAKQEAMTEFEQRQAVSSTQAAIQQFQSDPANRFFDNVRPQMAALLQSGSATSIKEAYDAACWANPQIRAILISESAAASPTAKPGAAIQARAAAKATNGAPAAGLRPAAAVPDANRSLRDTIVAARDAQVGRA